MRKLGACWLAIAMCIAPRLHAQAREPSPSVLNANGAINRTMTNEIFLFGRAGAFHDMIAQRNCSGFDQSSLAAANQRLENARARLAARYGEKLFPPDRPLTPMPDGLCDQGALSAYINHIAEIEQALAMDH